MGQTVDEALAAATPVTDGIEYRLVKLPLTATMAAAGIVAESREPFCGLIVDQYEVTLLLAQEAWEQFEQRLSDSKISAEGYRLITLNVQLELGLVGFMARVSRAFADSSIPILTYAAYTRDHFFVPQKHFDAAWSIVRQLCANDS